MTPWPADLAPLLVGVILAWAGGFKVAAPTARQAAARSALPRLVGERRALPAYRLLGGVEAAVAAALLLPPAYPAEAVGAVVLSLGFLGYLVYARVVAPDSSCGCMSASTGRISWRAFTRSGVLVAASALAMGADRFWMGAVGERPWTAALVLLAGATAVVALSPELDYAWLFPLRRLRDRLRHPLRALPFDVPLESTVQQLQQSEVYGKVGGLLRSGVQDTWDDGEWRILCYTARYDGRQATAVFAVPRLRYQPDGVRVALVDEAEQSTLLRLGPPDRALT